MRIVFIISMLLRRILSQWKLELCLFLGLCVTMSVISAIPIYTDGVLQQLFMKQLRAADTDAPPFVYTASIIDKTWESRPLTVEKIAKDFKHLKDYPVDTRLSLPLVCGGWSASLFNQMEVSDSRGSTVSMEVIALTGMDDLVMWEEGHMPADTVGPDGTVEIACSAKAADRLGLMIGKTYTMMSVMLPEKKESIGDNPDSRLKTELKFRLAGIFTVRPDRAADPRWLILPDFPTNLFVNPDILMRELVMNRKAAVKSIDLSWVLDYRKIEVRDLSRIVSVIESMGNGFSDIDPNIELTPGPLDLFKRFLEEKKALQLRMLTLTIPTLALVFYFTLLIAGLIVDRRRGEIAMLRNRGAHTLQMTGMFALEWTILATGCLAVGPIIGLIFAYLIGSSAGFLDFVDRTSLSVGMSWDVYLYSALLALVMIAAATIPALRACATGILEYKQNRSRSHVKPVWQRFYLDFALAGFGIYGYRMLLLQDRLAERSASGSEFDPLLFLVPGLLTLSWSLILARFFPPLLGLILRIVRRRKGVMFYSSLMEVSRNISHFRPIIILVVLTTATGIYGAALARTLDKNLSDRIYYESGADLVISESWHRLIANPFGSGVVLDKEHSFEPPFSIHRELPGVRSVARVQTTEGVDIANNSYSGKATVMAIDPWDFGHTAWFRRGLTRVPLVTCLNLLTQYPQSAIVSRSLIHNGSFSLGDRVTLRMNGGIVHLTVAGIVDYWPTLYDDKTPFVIVNLGYLTEQSSIRPYNIWARLEKGAKIEPIMKALASHSVNAGVVSEAKHRITLIKRDPVITGFYGIISIGFCVSLIITITGLVLFSLVNIGKRLSQFGILRAIGLSPRGLTGILCLEQILTAGTGVVIGTLFGQITSMLFVPFLRSSVTNLGTTPPFLVTVSAVDIMTIYCILVPAIIFSLAGLSVSLGRMQIHQAVKLGEDS